MYAISTMTSIKIEMVRFNTYYEFFMTIYNIISIIYYSYIALL